MLHSLVDSALKFSTSSEKKSRLCKLDITKKRIFAVRYEKSVIAHNKKNHILKNIQIYGFN